MSNAVSTYELYEAIRVLEEQTIASQKVLSEERRKMLALRTELENGLLLTSEKLKTVQVLTIENQQLRAKIDNIMQEVEFQYKPKINAMTKKLELSQEA